mmetsp:Transcript_17393/g.15305  ORF Transcript_17393/g.15305 Transcript_17393/m.15305 type:complete len:315 (-) Transcript_17393:810-1754(-)
MSETVDSLLNLLLSEDTFFDESLGVKFKDILLLIDDLVHQWLGERGLIQFIVTIFSVTNKINEDILLELHSILQSKLHNLVNFFRFISINVEYWGFNRLGNICTIKTTSSIFLDCSETNLVVTNNVNSTSNLIVIEVPHLEGFINDTLTSNSSITMDSNRENFFTINITHMLLEGSSSSGNQGVDGFKMGRIGQHTQLDLLSVLITLGGCCTKMVLDVTSISPTFFFNGKVLLELAQNFFVLLADNLSQCVESSSVGHTEDNSLDISIDSLVNQIVETRNHGVTSLDTKSLGGGEFILDDVGEAFIGAKSVKEG